MDKIRDIFLYFVAAISMLSVLCAVYQAMNGQKASAVTLGTLFLITALIVFIPNLEFLKVWGVEAKLSRTLDRAEEIISKMKRLSAISARSSYLTIAWGNRLGTPSAKDKQAVLDDIDAQLTDLKITPEERAVIVLPWVRMVRIDFFSLFTRVVREFATLKASDLVAKIQATNSQEANEASIAHSELITPWSQRTNNFQPLERLESKTLSAVIDEYLPSKGGWLSDKELAAIEVFKQELIRLNADCENKGGYTVEAAAYYDRYSNQQKEKATELWGASKR